MMRYRIELRSHPARQDRRCRIAWLALLVLLPGVLFTAGCGQQETAAMKAAKKHAIANTHRLLSDLSAGSGHEFEIRNRIVTLDEGVLPRIRPYPAPMADLIPGVERTCARLDSGRRPDEIQEKCGRILSFMRACDAEFRKTPSLP